MPNIIHHLNMSSTASPLILLPAPPGGHMPFPTEDENTMFRGEKVDICMFGFILVIICIVSGLFSCLVNVISKQAKSSFQNRNRYLLLPSSSSAADTPDTRSTMCRNYSATAAREDILY